MNELVNTNEMEDPSPVANQRMEEKEYRPSTQQALREYEISIRFLSRGCVVRVGCQEIPFESVDNARNEINAYMSTPYETQKRWREILK